MAQQTYRIDQAATWSGVIYLSCEPRLRRGEQVQDSTSDGIPKWELQCMATFRGFGDKTERAILKFGCASVINPGEGLTEYTPVQLIEPEVGFMARNDRDGQAVGTIWYRVTGVRSLVDVPQQNGRRPAAAPVEG